MARLLLIRHGQASFGADDYDALSDRGHEQAAALGRVLAARGVRPTLLLRGTMRRHRETLDGLGLDAPVVTDANWNEFDFQHVVEVHRPHFRDRAAMMAELNRSEQPGRAFQAIFDEATARWCSGAFDAEYAESFAAFRTRVAAALTAVAALLREHRDVVAVSSGGPIAIAAALLTAGPDAPANTLATIWAALNRVSVNTGVTKIIAGRAGLSLSTFNEHTHTETEPRLLSYR
ncbi:phosphoglycerate mutase [Actinoplanes sp. SE50]|uniref:histidine phosphatase family protein n=1 Tax=unclassified Actinoplanes TaxID=2626549 RepID=UPI00023EC805|nr:MULTISPECIES: phosphoglycerate mutase family protein [unclassified Actinoplanes]AEV85353.1 phosphoglycerate mutase [Actinoplanes sp. SE50/110]ATO83748.1 phosphoglycerate mutase [Actinoplanes sp. SE50]SLM01156.1 phosphoglycerate mutase [Actinoplanes sp. SE50/110]